MYLIHVIVLYCAMQFCCLFSAIAPMVQCAKGLAQNPRDPNAVSQWRGANHQVIPRLHSLRNLGFNFSPSLIKFRLFPYSTVLIIVNFDAFTFTLISEQPVLSIVYSNLTAVILCTSLFQNHKLAPKFSQPLQLCACNPLAAVDGHPLLPLLMYSIFLIKNHWSLFLMILSLESTLCFISSCSSI